MYLIVAPWKFIFIRWFEVKTERERVTRRISSKTNFTTGIKFHEEEMKFIWAKLIYIVGVCVCMCVFFSFVFKEKKSRSTKN